MHSVAHPGGDQATLDRGELSSSAPTRSSFPAVLLIEDNPAEARLIRETLAELPTRPFSLDWTDRLSSGLARLSEGAFDLILLDLLLPDAEDLEGLQAIRSQFPGVPVVVLTTLADETVADRVIQGGAQDYLVKGQINADTLSRSVRYAIERQHAEQALREREAQLRRLQLVTDSTLAHLGADELPGELLGRIREALAADAAAIFLVDEARAELVSVAAKGLATEIEGRIPIGDGFAGRVAAERRVITMEDLTGVELESPFLAQQRIRAVLGAPLLVQDRLLGVIYVGIRRPHRFTTDQVQLLELVTQRVAPAIEMARLYRELEQAVQMRDHVLAVAAHDLRGPLTNIRLRASVSRIQATRSPATGIEPLLDQMARIEQATIVMDRLINELVDAAQLQAGCTLELNRTQGDLVEIVHSVVAELVEHQDPKQHPITLETGSVALVGKWDQPRLARVVRNLLENAVKYSPDGSEIAVRAARERQGGAWAVLSVRDHGLGIPANDVPRIFSRFHRGANVAGKIPGTGIGLASAQQIVEQHRGSIEVESCEGIGTTFTVRLPLLSSGEGL